MMRSGRTRLAATTIAALAAILSEARGDVESVAPTRTKEESESSARIIPTVKETTRRLFRIEVYLKPLPPEVTDCPATIVVPYQLSRVGGTPQFVPLGVSLAPAPPTAVTPPPEDEAAGAAIVRDPTGAGSLLIRVEEVPAADLDNFVAALPEDGKQRITGGIGPRLGPLSTLTIKHPSKPNVCLGLDLDARLPTRAKNSF